MIRVPPTKNRSGIRPIRFLRWPIVLLAGEAESTGGGTGGPFPKSDAQSVPSWEGANQQRATSEAGAAANPLSPRILVVDDDASVRRVCTFALRYDGWQPEGIASASVALQRIVAGERFDVVVLDYAMPGLDGLGFLRALNERAVAQRPGIVMASAHADGATALEAMKLGVWDFLSKPLTPEDLRHGVRRLLQRQQLAATGEPRSQAMLAATRREWSEALRALAGAPRPADILVHGLLAQIAGDSDRAAQSFARCNWGLNWVHGGPETWGELARRLAV